MLYLLKIIIFLIFYSEIFIIFLTAPIGVKLENLIILYGKPSSAYIKLVVSLIYKFINTFLLISFIFSEPYLLTIFRYNFPNRISNFTFIGRRPTIIKKK